MPLPPYSAKQYRRALSVILKSLRRKSRLSQEEAAAQSEIDRSHLSELEAGEHDPGSYKLAALAAIYGVSFEEAARRIEQMALGFARKRKRNHSG